MKKFLLGAAMLCGSFGISFAQNEMDSTMTDSLLTALLNQQSDSIESSLKWQTGKVDLSNGLATLNVPEGYKYLDPKQSAYVLTDLWGNPPGPTLGMLFPDSTGPLSNFTYAIEISYNEDGHVDDEDANDIDYAEMLVELQKDANAANLERKKQGYPTVALLGWASAPYYDATSKKLHWAKELKFEGTEVNTLNYNICVLGREGMLMMNVISDMPYLPLIKKDMNQFLGSVEFNKGNTYAEFDPDIDKVAAYGIGALVAGKVLGKVGLWAVIAKFGKVIVIGLIAIGSMFGKRILGFFRKKQAMKESPVSGNEPPPAV